MLAHQSRFPDVLGFVLSRMSRWPRRVLDGFGYLAYVLVYRVLRWRRALSATNIANAFPEKSPAERADILQQSYRNLGRFLAEALWGWNASAEALGARVRIVNPELITRFTAQGQSVVLLAAHFCNWEWLLLAAGVALKIPIDAVYKPQRVRGIDEFLKARRARFGGNPIPHQSFMFEVMKRRNDVRAYALVADHTPKHNEEKHWTRFLNQDTAFFVGADKIARILKAPVIYVAMRRDGPGHYSVDLELLAEPPYDRDSGPEIVEKFARVLEEEIRRSPADWLWLHRKWKYGKPLYA
ncbi:MAG: lysophospholipid acyltransferase family protein [Burkholderiales bacterium]|nr:lysophospholipid acyltransferase family protein [Burkholderiales bacterium]